MWFFDWFETHFGDLSDKFESIADAVDGVPVIGDYLAYPFDNISTFFSNLKTASGSASDWVDEIIQDISDLTDDALTWVNELWDETDLIWDKIGTIPVLTEEVIKGWVSPWITTAKEALKNALDAAITTINTTITNLTTQLTTVTNWISNAPTWFTTQLEAAKDKVIGWIEDSFILIVEKVMEHEKEE